VHPKNTPHLTLTKAPTLSPGLVAAYDTQSENKSGSVLGYTHLLTCCVPKWWTRPCYGLQTLLMQENQENSATNEIYDKYIYSNHTI